MELILKWVWKRYISPLVLDLVTQVRDVVFVKCIFSFGKPQGVGISEWGVYGVEWEMGRSVYEQPGTEVDRNLSQQGGFQVSKREQREQKGWRKGKQKARGLLTNCIACPIFVYIVNACNCLNNCQSILCVYNNYRIMRI